jgi:hypothetical protein
MASNEQDINREIRVAAQKLAGTYNKDLLHLCECIVTEVDFDSRTCTCSAVNDTSTTSIELVRFQSVVDDGVILVPKIGSSVTVLLSIRIQPMIVMYSELDNVYIVAPKVQFNKGQLGGLVKVIDLTTKLNNLEKLVNDLVTKYNLHTHVTTCPAGAGSASPTPNIESQVLTPTQRTDIENKAIIQ